VNDAVARLTETFATAPCVVDCRLGFLRGLPGFEQADRCPRLAIRNAGIGAISILQCGFRFLQQLGRQWTGIGERQDLIVSAVHHKSRNVDFPEILG
jgi:hypothetical protein